MLRDGADQVASGTVRLTGDGEERTVTVPERPRYEAELGRLTGSETGQQQYETRPVRDQYCVAFAIIVRYGFAYSPEVPFS